MWALYGDPEQTDSLRLLNDENFAIDHFDRVYGIQHYFVLATVLWFMIWDLGWIDS